MEIKKNLSNYFDSWCTVKVDYKAASFTADPTIESGVVVPNVLDYIDRWASEFIGIRGLRWDRYYADGNGRTTSFGWVYKFKSDSDAMMFVLKFGGSIIQKNQ